MFPQGAIYNCLAGVYVSVWLYALDNAAWQFYGNRAATVADSDFNDARHNNGNVDFCKLGR